MPIEPFPQDWELISFFETEAVWDYPDIAPHGTQTYTTELQDNERVECAVDRYSYEMSIKWYRNDALVLALDLHWINEFLIHSAGGEEVAVLRFKDENLDELRFRLRPTPSLSWGIKMYP